MLSGLAWTGSSNVESTRVFHFVHMRGLGGVQIAFDNAHARLLAGAQGRFSHHVISPRGCDGCYSSTQRNLTPMRQARATLSYLLHRRRSSSIAHFHNLLPSENVLRLNRVLGARNIILHEHGAAWNAAEGDPTISANGRMANLVLCNSNAAARLLNRKFGIPQSKIRVLFNGIFDAAAVPPGSRALTDRSEFAIGFFGRLESNKGVHVLLQAVEQLPAEARSICTVYIYGEGALAAGLQKRFGADRYVRFMGRSARPLEAMANMNVIVAPSIREPFGNVVAEAGLLGVPVIAANVDGIPEAVGAPDNAILLEPTDSVDTEFIGGSTVPLPELVYFPAIKEFSAPKQISPATLSEWLCAVIADYPFFQEKAKSHRRYVLEHMSTQRYAEELMRIYDSLAL